MPLPPPFPPPLTNRLRHATKTSFLTLKGDFVLVDGLLSSTSSSQPLGGDGGDGDGGGEMSAGDASAEVVAPDGARPGITAPNEGVGVGSGGAGGADIAGGGRRMLSSGVRAYEHSGTATDWDGESFIAAVDEDSSLPEFHGDGGAWARPAEDAAEETPARARAGRVLMSWGGERQTRRGEDYDRVLVTVGVALEVRNQRSYRRARLWARWLKPTAIVEAQDAGRSWFFVSL